MSKRSIIVIFGASEGQTAPVTHLPFIPLGLSPSRKPTENHNSNAQAGPRD